MFFECYLCALVYVRIKERKSFVVFDVVATRLWRPSTLHSALYVLVCVTERAMEAGMGG